MKREIVKTKDGLKTINLPEWNESYHSTHGAYQEAMHVFIESGFNQIDKEILSVLEIGFGTGLNAILTFIESLDDQQVISYTSLEAYPVSIDEVEALAFFEFPEIKPHKDAYLKMHSSDWGKYVEISDTFQLRKVELKLEDFEPEKELFDVVYFDAFGPRVQPHLWSKEIFKKMYDGLKPGGIFVTYSAKGQVRRDLIEVGFEVEKIPGPPGKREMLRAKK